MSAAQTLESTSSSGKAVIGTGVLWLVLYFAIRMFVEANQALPSGVRLGLAFVPTPVFALFL